MRSPPRPKLLLLDEVAGGLSEVECETLVGLIRRIRASGVSMIWIEHVVHALLAAVDRIVVLAGGGLIADDRPAAVDPPSQGRRNLHGYSGRVIDSRRRRRRCGSGRCRCLKWIGLTAFYGDFQALYGVSMAVDAGQAVAVIGANGAGKSTLLKAIVGMIRARRDDPLRRRADRRHAAAAKSSRAASLWCPRAGGCFRR